MADELEKIEKLTAGYGEEYKKAVDKVIREIGLPTAYQDELLTKIHGLAFPRAGGRASAAAKKRRADEGLGVGEGMEEPIGEGVMKDIERDLEGIPINKADNDAGVIGDTAPREGAISYKAAHPKGTPLAKQNQEWNPDNEIKKASGDAKKLFTMHAFNMGPEDTATGYRFAHHLGGGNQAAVKKAIDGCLMKSADYLQKQDEPNHPEVTIDEAALKNIMAHLQQHADEFDPTKDDAPEVAPETAPTPQAEAVNEKPVPKVPPVPPDKKTTPLSTTVKADEDIEKAVKPAQDAPIADTGSWDGAGAQNRLLEWAGGPDKEKVDWTKFGRGFLYHDPNDAANLKGYKYPVADIVNGQFKINRTALGAAAGRINQSTGIPPAEVDRMKATLRSYYSQIDAEPPANIVKMIEPTVPLYIGKNPKITFVAASPGVIEGIRKQALVGPAGKAFAVHYLKPLGMTRDDIAITYLVPNVLKNESGKTRVPTGEEIEGWSRYIDLGMKKANAPIIVGLGYTVKTALAKDLNFTLPHPNSINRFGAKQELERKLKQIQKALREVTKARGQEQSLNNPTTKK